ncbi:MAG: GLUG motif-containing protein, partial [Veillonellales bacterium]
MQRKWKRRWQRLAKLLLPPVASGVLLLSAYGPVFANPAGSTVTSGAASIATNAKTMTVTQTTDKAAINWQSFNISSGEKVQFIQPGTSSVALNRVVGNDASSIYGTLSANGKVFLINPNGVLFAPGAQINTGGLVASTLNISDKNFVTGNYTFSGSGAGSVVNRGTITAANEAVLIGPQVKNEGVIAAKVTGLASGNKVSLDFSGDNLLNVAVDTGAAGGSAVNNGTITADGGLVVMSAGTKDALLTTVVNNSGIIRAQSVNKTNGVIRLEGNRAINSGTLDASGKAAGQTGGTIKVLGDTVTLAQDSNIDVSGDAGGGTTLIGGNFHGQGTEYTATATIVDQGAAITADALTMGNGGKVAVWSNSTTTFAGTISAKGGSKSGSGGSVETSGHTLTVASTAKVNTLADHGTTGSWLLDPYNFTIDDTGTAGMKAADLSADLQASNVTIQTLDGRVSASGVPQTISCTAASNGDINVNSEVDWSSHTLTLSAYNNIHINAPMNAAGTAGLALEYGQAAAAGNTCSYYVNAPVNLASTASFSTKLGSSGATNTYTIVNSTDGLAQMNFSSDYYALGTNLDFNGQGRTTSVIPIFSGTLAGLGHTISNLTIHSDNIGYIGLFGASGGTIRDVGLIDDTVTSTGNNSYNVGGLVGLNAGGTITDCYATGSVSATGSSTYAGGLVGQNDNGTITNCYSTGSVSGNSAGGLVGWNYYGGTIKDCYATGTVSGNSAGGLAGKNTNNATIADCYATGTVSATASSSYVGGLVGQNDVSSTISNCYWDVFSSNTTAGVGYGGTGTNGSIAGVTSGSDTSIYHSAFSKASYAFTDAAGADNFDADWYMIDGSTRPFLRSEYSTTITNAHQLQLIAMNLGANYTLGNNIDMSELTQNSGLWRTVNTKDSNGNYGFVPIDDGANSFTGTFDGDVHTIKGLTITSNASCVGLFGSSTGTIRDVGLEHDTITGTGNNGYYYPVGGLVGYNYNGTITNCYATGTVSTTTSNSYVGGLVGWNHNGTITNCYAAGTVSTTASYSDVGGLVGNNLHGTITDCYAVETASATASISSVGGLVGGNGGTIKDCYAMGTVSGTGSSSDVGGLVGYNGSGIKITDCYAAEAVSATDSSSSVGGLAGKNDGTVGVDSTGASSPCYWDTSRTTNGYGSNNGTFNPTLGGTAASGGLTTAQAKDTSYYSGWDFNSTWYRADSVNNDYPILRSSPYVLTIIANNKTITYGEAIPHLTYSCDKLWAGDTTDVITGLSLSTTTATTPAAGSYIITAGGASATSSNGQSYIIIYKDGTLTINKRPIIINPTPGQSKIYGNDDPALTYSVGATTSDTGIVNNDSVSYTGALARNSGENARDYPITLGNLVSANSNYTVSLSTAPVNFTITQRPIIITPTAGQSKIYGNDDPALTYSVGAADANTGIVNNDRVSYTGALSRNTGENAANYAITAGNLSSTNSNYAVSLRTAPVNFTITQR